jgi:hypothetical protein
MKHKKEKNSKARVFGVVTLITFTCLLSTVSAQESINPTGGNVSGNGGSVSYSVGQVADQILIGTNGSVAGGVQQPYEISVITSIVEADGISILVAVYPNPTIDYLTLEVMDFEVSSLHFQLYDLNGRLIQSENIRSNHTRIDMGMLAASSYIVRVLQENKEVKMFKVVKR